jgi:hypothetical protein
MGEGEAGTSQIMTIGWRSASPIVKTFSTSRVSGTYGLSYANCLLQVPR